MHTLGLIDKIKIEWYRAGMPTYIVLEKRGTYMIDNKYCGGY